MPRIYNMKNNNAPVGAVYVGRPTKWGNPFTIGKDGPNRKKIIEKYKAWLCDQPDLLKDLHELTGKNLICWCSPLECHAEILRTLANDDLAIKSHKFARILLKSDLGDFL